MSVSAKIVDEIMKNMPQGAEKYLIPNGTGSFTLHIHWKLNNDPKRPNKYSKTIAIFLSKELMADFPKDPEFMHQYALSKITAYIAARLKGFIPEHNSARGVAEPVEEWTFPADQVLG